MTARRRNRYFSAERGESEARARVNCVSEFEPVRVRKRECAPRLMGGFSDKMVHPTGFEPMALRLGI